VITFKFRLQRVLDFRRAQFQIAEAACQRATAQLHAVQARNAALASRKSDTKRAFSHLSEVAGRELSPLTGWYEWTLTEQGRLMNLERAAAQELCKRRDALVEAQRKVRLLEKLEKDRRIEWQAAFDREIEELAADSTNSRYTRGEGL
jgi:hypothetical protein